MRHLRNIFILIRYRHLIVEVGEIMDKPAERDNREILSGLSLEELEGFETLNAVYRLVHLSKPSLLSKELKYVSGKVKK